MKNYKLIAFNNYRSEVEKNKKLLDGYLGYQQIEDLMETLYHSDTDADCEKYQKLEDLLEIAEDLYIMHYREFLTVEDFTTDEDAEWWDWLESADLNEWQENQ